MNTKENSAVVETKELVKTYRQGEEIEVHAVRGVSLQVVKGEFTAIVGPSGSGKTTLLNLLGALDMPTSGKAFIDGIDLSTMNRTERSALRRDRIGFVFQSYNLVPVMTAYENAEVVMALQGIDEEKRREDVMDLLKEVGLEGYEHRRPNQLSGGQQQRVAIARAIAAKPSVILADEPTANVDSETANLLLGIMEKMNREHEATFIFSTHDPRVIKRARRVITLVDGSIESDKPQ
jgi:putative ABC transport system ATP-binding protein